MSSIQLFDHVIITGAVLGLHLLLLWIGTPFVARHPRATDAQRRLWRSFIGLQFLVFVAFANVSMLLPKGPPRIAALVAVLVNAMLILRWKVSAMKIHDDECDLKG